MNFLYDSIWQFIGVVVAVILGLAGIIVALVLA